MTIKTSIFKIAAFNLALLSGSGAMAAVAPINGFSSPTITAQTGVVSDHFVGTQIDRSTWFTSSNSGGSISQGGGVLTMEGPSMLSTYQDAFSEADFTYQAQVTLVDDGLTDSFCFINNVGPMFVAVCKTTDPTAPFTELVIVGSEDNSGVQITSHTFLPDGSLNNGMTLTFNLSLNTAANTLSGSVPELGFSESVSGFDTSQLALPSVYSILDGSSDAIVSVDSIVTDIEMQEHVASLAPFELDGTAYDSGISASPGTIHINFIPGQGAPDQEYRTEVLADNTVVPLLLESNLNIALVQSVPGTLSNVGDMHTIVTNLSNSELSLRPEIQSVDAFINDAYLYQGSNQDYLTNLVVCPDDIQSLRNQLQTEIGGLKGKSAKSHKSQLASIEADIDSDDIQAALSGITILRDAIIADSKIKANTSALIVDLLDDLEQSLQTLLVCNI